MGHDIKRIADDEWESGNPIDFRGRQTKNNYAQRAYADFNDDNYLALGLDAMKETGDNSGQYARYNVGTDSRKALDIAHLNLDDYYGSHITGAGLGNAGTAYSYDAAALKVLPRDIGKLSTNEQGDIAPPPGGLRPKDYKSQRRSMGLPDVIPTVTQPTYKPYEVEQEDEAPPDLEEVGDPTAKPKDSDADIQAARMAAASGAPTKTESHLKESVSGAGDAGGTVQFQEELDTMRTSGGRTFNTKHPDVQKIRAMKGTKESEKLRAKEQAPPSAKEAVAKMFAKKTEESSGEEEEGDEETEATSRAGGGAGGGFKAGHKFKTRQDELQKAFPGITNTRKNSKEASYNSLSKGQQKFMVSIAQGKAGKLTEDLTMNYAVDQGTATERQHDYMMKMIEAHDKADGKKGLTGWATNLTEIAREIPSLSLGQLFSLSPAGRDLVYTSVKAPGALDKKLRPLPDHDLDVLLTMYKKSTTIKGTRGEVALAAAVKPQAEAEAPESFGERMKRLKAKGYER
jgi:hypothetical protein